MLQSRIDFYLSRPCSLLCVRIDCPYVAFNLLSMFASYILNISPKQPITLPEIRYILPSLVSVNGKLLCLEKRNQTINLVCI